MKSDLLFHEDRLVNLRPSYSKHLTDILPNQSEKRHLKVHLSLSSKAIMVCKI